MIGGARTYHLEFSRTKVRGPRVKAPRHFLLYRRRSEGFIEVARIAYDSRHDSREILRHLPQVYRQKVTDE